MQLSRAQLLPVPSALLCSAYKGCEALPPVWPLPNATAAWGSALEQAGGRSLGAGKAPVTPLPCPSSADAGGGPEPAAALAWG